MSTITQDIHALRSRLGFEGGLFLDDLMRVALELERKRVEAAKYVGEIKRLEAELRKAAEPSANPRQDPMSCAFEEIRTERQYQDSRWGGPSHDDGHTEQEWYRLIGQYAGGERGNTRNLDGYQRFIAIAALAVAAVEAHDRFMAEALEASG